MQRLVPNPPGICPADHLWSTAECAAYLGCKPKTLENDRSKGTRESPPFVKVGRLVRYYPPAVFAWVESRLRHSTSEVSQ